MPSLALEASCPGIGFIAGTVVAEVEVVIKAATAVEVIVSWGSR